MDKKAVLKEVLSISIYLLIVLVITYLVIFFVGQKTVVVGPSMENTLYDGDNLIVDKISYRFHEPERYDIIVFPYEYRKDTYYIKRVIGIPGDSVYIDGNGNIYLNDELLVEPYGKESIKDPGIASTTIHLGADEYFVLGDNRNDSLDSREASIGVVKKDEIVGRAWLRIYPFKSFGFVTDK